MTSITCYLGIGSNIETDTSTRKDYMTSAVRQLAQHERITVSKASHIYETVPVGYADQENFYNAVVEIETTMSPRELIRFCLDVVEKRAGRIRTTPNGPRTLDVDILLFGDEVVNEEGLTIPHPRMNERAFVLVPLAEIAPHLVKDLSTYDLVDSPEGVTQVDAHFDAIISSYKEEE